MIKQFNSWGKSCTTGPPSDLAILWNERSLSYILTIDKYMLLLDIRENKI